MLFNPALAAKIEIDYVATHSHMPRPESSQSITAIIIRINIAAWSHEACGENTKNTSHHSFTPEIRATQVASHNLAHRWQRLTKLQQALELLALATLDLVFVIEVLPTAGCISAHGLNGAARCWIDGHVGPCRRNDEGSDALQISSGNLAAISMLVAKASLRRAEAANADVL